MGLEACPSRERLDCCFPYDAVSHLPARSPSFESADGRARSPPSKNGAASRRQRRTASRRVAWQRHDGPYSSAAVAGLDLQLSADLAQAFAHAGDADADGYAHLLVALTQPGREAPSFIADLEPDSSRVATDSDRGGGAAGMSKDVAQAFFAHPKQGGLDLGGGRV